jgi:hypothetical protein
MAAMRAVDVAMGLVVSVIMVMVMVAVRAMNVGFLRH